MPDLIAQGPQPDDRWRRKLQPEVRYAIGRQAGAWSTPWDDRISRRHVEIVFRNGRLYVETVESARNPVFFRGSRTERFSLLPGDHFVIGQTTFSLVEERVDVSIDLPRPAGERTFTIDELRRQPFREADKRIDVLSRLPDVIRGSDNDQELFVRLVNLLLGGIEHASAAAVVVAATKNQSGGPPDAQSLQPAIEVLHWDRRILAGTGFCPSQRLIRQAIESRESVVHVWCTNQPHLDEAAMPAGSTDATVPAGAESAEAAPRRAPASSGAAFTVSEGVDWAFCTPVPGDACAGWGLYVTGSFTPDLAPLHGRDAESLRDEVKFTELTAATLGGLRQSRLLATRQASLSQFFSPVVLAALASQDAGEALAPREADVTVLFCDLRGFTRESERSAGNLFGLLERVSQALGVMTRQILDSGGVVGDFHGDAAMGFWGWPLPQPDAVERACRAALHIRSAFASSPASAPGQAAALSTNTASVSTTALANFRVGIGIASGRAVAGKIGTIDQVKVTVFGPVVNLASRLETMTRQLRASILIDPPTAAVIRASVPSTVCRVRRVAKVRPVGLAAPIEVSEILPPAGEHSELTDEHLAAYEAALVAFESRDWTLALKHLHAVPADDQVADFLTLFIAQHARTPPPNWDGSIPLQAK